MATIKVHGITVAYDQQPVLEAFSLEVGSGDFVAIIGPNGSGKTTLLRTIARVLRPKVGSVLVDEQEVQSLPPREIAQKIGVVPQEERTPFDFTCFDIVLMGRTPYLLPLSRLSSRDLTIVEGAMKATGVWHLRDRYFTQTSGGERKRVVIARALAQEPPILMLDEPTANLDIKFQLEVMGLLQRLNAERQITVLVVMHDLNLAAMSARKFVLMNQNGRIHALGSAEEVLTEKNLQDVYGAPVLVSRHPVTDKLTITLMPPSLDKGTDDAAS